MLIRVTKDHIEKGVPREGESCPVALAIQEQAGLGAVHVGIAAVTREELSFDPILVCRYHAYLPFEASEFIDRFDAGDLVEPFEFELDTNALRGIT